MFQFKQFKIEQDECAMKVGTDGVLLGAWAHGGLSVLDVGTGTGIIALMMAQRYPDAQVLGIDIDEGAVRQATANIQASPFIHQIHIVQTKVQEMDESYAGCFDAMVSNPPFFIDSLQAPDHQRSVARHTETLTYADLMKAARRLLGNDGELSVIVPFDYRRRMDDEAIFQSFFPSRVCAIKTTPTKPVRRYLLAYKKQPCPCEQTELVIGDEQYTLLTGDFYL
ncbi:MAG: methyltransferase [Prevotella sp.]|nr:methyltransferase [Prevotella sp.]